MKLLFVTQDFPPSIGGIQTYAASLADVFAEGCDAFEVMAPAQEGQESLDAGLPYRVHRVGTSSNWMRLKGIPSLLKVARETRPDVILTGHWYMGAGALLAQKLGYTRKVFVAAHAMELRKNLLPGPLAPLYEAHRRQVIRKADGLFPVSRFTGGLLREEGVDESRIHVVPNGTEVERFDTEEARKGAPAIREKFHVGERPLLLTVSRLVERKGIDTVLDSMALVLERHPEAVYLVVGHGPAVDGLKAQSERLGLQENVIFGGKLPYKLLPSVYHACDIFVMPARQIGPSVEGFGLVFCEANACGKPVIGGNSGGVPDAIVDGVTGRLIEPNSPSACAEAICALLDDRDEARRLGEQGLKRVKEEGTWQHSGRRMIRVMEEACESS